MAVEITLEPDAPRKVANQFSGPMAELIRLYEAGTPQRIRIPAADVASDDDRKRYIRQARDAANALGWTAGTRQPDDDDESGDLLLGIRPKIVHKPHAKPQASA